MMLARKKGGGVMEEIEEHHERAIVPEVAGLVGTDRPLL